MLPKTVVLNLIYLFLACNYYVSATLVVRYVDSIVRRLHVCVCIEAVPTFVIHEDEKIKENRQKD